MKPEEWIEIQCKGRCERDCRLLARAVNTFYKNIINKKEKCTALPWGNSLMIMPSWAVYRGVWNWDSAFHAMAVSKWDPSLAREQLEFFFKTQREDGCFIDSCEENGDMTDQLTKPPVLFWAYVVIDKADPDDSLLSEHTLILPGMNPSGKKSAHTRDSFFIPVMHLKKGMYVQNGKQDGTHRPALIMG